MLEINITVENKIAIKADETEYICGNSDFVVNFNFDSEWEAYETKTARFSYNGSYIDVVFSGSQCTVPIIKNTYCFFVGVYAGNLHTTTPARVPCKLSILCGSDAPSVPSDNVYNQIMDKLNSISGGSASITMRVDGGYIQYSTDKGETWVNLIAEADLKGDKGDPGTPGKNGTDGHTPVKGTDYWTAADKDEIVAEVVSALPKYEGATE